MSNQRKIRKDGSRKKIRRDAKLLNLPEKDRRLVAEWVRADGAQLCLQRIASQMHIQCSQVTLYGAMAYWESEEENDKARAMALAQLRHEEADKTMSTAEFMAALDRRMAMLKAAAKDDKGYNDARYLIIADESARTKADLESLKLKLKERGLAQKDQEIAVLKARFQRDTCELFVKWSADERAKSVLNSTGTNAEKIEALGQQMFGEDWNE